MWNEKQNGYIPIPTATDRVLIKGYLVVCPPNQGLNTPWGGS